MIDEPQTLVGAPGAVVRGGIIVRSSGVTIRNVDVVGGEHGSPSKTREPSSSKTWRSPASSWTGSISAARAASSGTAEIALDRDYTHGIDVSFAFDLETTMVHGRTVVGGYEGIVSHFAHVDLRDNFVSGTSLRGIT